MLPMCFTCSQVEPRHRGSFGRLLRPVTAPATLGIGVRQASARPVGALGHHHGPRVLLHNTQHTQRDALYIYSYKPSTHATQTFHTSHHLNKGGFRLRHQTSFNQKDTHHHLSAKFQLIYNIVQQIHSCLVRLQSSTSIHRHNLQQQTEHRSVFFH